MAKAAAAPKATPKTNNTATTHDSKALAKLQPHPLTMLTPEMPVDQIVSLAEDIKRNGLKTPIVMYEGKVLDGRARVAACIKAGVDATSVTLPAGTAPRAYVFSMNIHRRQLSGVQLARVAAQYMTDNKGKLTQEEVADLFGLGAKTLRYVMRAIESGNAGLVKLLENPDTTRGDLRAGLVAADIMPDNLKAGDIGAEVAVEPAPFKGTQAASDDADDILGTDKPTANGGTVQRATDTAPSNVGHGAAAAKAATHKAGAAAVTHTQAMTGMVDTLARATAQDLEAFYKAAVQRGVWSRLQKLHADNEGRLAVAKAQSKSKGLAKVAK